MSRLRPRLSLLTAILLTTIVGLSIVTFRLWHEVEPLRAQVRSMRTELGQLNIDDPNVPQAVQLGSDKRDQWRWRVYLPSNRTLFVYTGKIPPRSGLTKNWYSAVKHAGSGTSGTFPKGEFVFEVRLEKEGVRWFVVTSRGNGNRTGRMSIDGDRLSREAFRSSGSSIGHDKAVRFHPNEPIHLFTLLEPAVTRVGGTTSWASPQGPANGVVVWIE